MPLFRKSIKKVERKEAQEALNHALQLDDTTALREAISPAESVVGVTPDEREKAKQKLRELEEEVDAAPPPPLPLDSLDDEQYRRKAAVKHVVGALKTAKRTSHRRDSIEALKGAIEGGGLPRLEFLTMTAPQTSEAMEKELQDALTRRRRR